MMMSPLTVEDKPLDVSARRAELTGFVYDAARDGLPAHELEGGLWPYLLRLGHELQAEYFALAADGDCGETRTLAGAVAGGQIVVLSADGKGVPLHKPAEAPAIAAHDHARGPRSPTGTRWRCSARPMTSSRIPAPPRR